MHPKDAAEIANSVDPDQTAPRGVVWSGSALFAQTCLSENLGTLRYLHLVLVNHFGGLSLPNSWTNCEHPHSHEVLTTVNFLNIRTPQKFVVITLKFKLGGSPIE